MAVRMRVLASVAIAVFVAGCATGPFARNPGTSYPTAAQAPRPEQVIAHVNANARHVQSVEFSDVSIQAKKGIQFVGVNGMLAYQKPRNFRLMASAFSTTQADVGSNDQEFWFMFKQDGSTLYYCSYEDYPRVRNLPLPIHPDWIAEALCIQEFGEASQYQTRVNKDRMEFAFQTTSAQGQPLQKVTSVALYGNHAGRVVQHVVRGEQGAEVWSAAITDYQTVQGVILPKRVTISCPSEKLELQFKLGGAAVNSISAERNGLTFRRPRGYNEVDLARGPSATPSSVQRVRGASN